jgi:hypothetical protein
MAARLAQPTMRVALPIDDAASGLDNMRADVDETVSTTNLVVCSCGSTVPMQWAAVRGLA